MDRTRERGQALIFFAVLAPIMFAVMGLALEGGTMFLEYRHMQSAADMAALIGAQNLPSNPTQAVTDACTFSQNNGYDNCANSGDSQTTVCVPPQSQTPYDGISYGPSNPSCAAPTAGTRYFYIEVQIRKQVQVFPIFSRFLGGAGTITLYTHAIAREGAPSPLDFAMAILDHTDKSALTLSGSKGVIIVGPTMSNSTDPTSINTGGSQDQISCNGQWLTAANETVPSHLQSQTGGSVDFSPPDCLPSGNYDSPVAFFGNQAQIPDPYCVSTSPPIQDLASTAPSTDCNGNPNMASGSAVTSMSNCGPCNHNAYYYNWDPTKNRNTGTWGGGGATPTDLSIGSSSSGSFELFPGIYKDITINNPKINVYLNPGVYTFTGSTGLKASGGNVCIYGAPICDVGVDGPAVIPGTTATTCQTADMTDTGSTNYLAGPTWYYYCSPWGMWDTNPCLGSNSASCTSSNATTFCATAGNSCPRPASLTTVPTFTDTTKNIPLNGVTFYLTGAKSSFNMNGGSYMTLAFPNPCPGTGAVSTTGHTASFQAQYNPTNTDAGEPSGGIPGASTYYSYPAGSIPAQDGVNQSPPNAWIYPDAEFTLNGECERSTSNYAGDVWPGEMPAPAGYPGLHLHFLIFARSSSISVFLNGGGQQNWWGILYDPGTQLCWKSSDPCQVSLTGSSGGGGTANAPPGPPMLIGQIIADNASIGGSATMEVFYRPCDPTVEACSTGPGSGLVQ